MHLIGRKIIFFIGALFGVIFSSIAQNNEIGGGIGGLNYTGDISRIYNPLNIRPAAQVFYRRNISPVVAAKFSLTLGNLFGSEQGYNSPISQTRNARFNGLLTEAAVMFEYNFFDYMVNYMNRKYAHRYSPYLTGGLCLFNYQSSSNINQSTDPNTQLAVPLGVGIKYMLTDTWNLGAEFIVRKTFSDKVDNVQNFTVNNKQTSDVIDNDSYYYLGFSISYTFYKIHCPER